MNPMAVNVSGNYTEKNRPNNGMERVGPYLNTHRLVRVPVVAYAEWHSHGETLTGQKMSVILPAIEPGITASGGDVPGLPVLDGYPTDAAGQIMWLLDSIRRTSGKGAVADTLFSIPSADIHDDPDDHVTDEDRQMPGQDAAISRDVAAGEVRIGSDGPRVVPPASGEEIMAERAEAKAAEDKVPAATFTAPGGDQ